MILSYRCACGIPLRYSDKVKAYVPLDPEAPRAGHRVAVVLRDGVEQRIEGAVCESAYEPR